MGKHSLAASTGTDLTYISVGQNTDGSLRFDFESAYPTTDLIPNNSLIQCIVVCCTHHMAQVVSTIQQLFDDPSSYRELLLSGHRVPFQLIWDQSMRSEAVHN